MTTPAFTRALELELDLKALDLAVRLICAGPAPDPSIDLWCDVIKPLTNALVGINRGMVPQAEKPHTAPHAVTLDEVIEKVVRNSVDTETEAKIQSALERLVRNRTTFAIAHRLSTLRNAHRLLALERSRLVEIGTHDELIAQDGLYARLCRLQQETSRVRAL